MAPMPSSIIAEGAVDISSASGGGLAAASAVPLRPDERTVAALPKVELHAHLSGCITQEFLLQLMKERAMETENSGLPFDCMEDMSASVDKCWVYFSKVAQVVTDLETLRRCSLHVLETFAADGCIYFEMRTSPKKLPKVRPGAVGTSGSSLGDAQPGTKRDYIKTVIDAIVEFRSRGGKENGLAQNGADDEAMDVKLLVSLDRTNISSIEDARAQVQDAVALCKEFDDFCVGIDICGNPLKPTLEPFLLPALAEVLRDDPDFYKRFPITCHTAETPEQEQENEAVVRNLGPLNIRRLGHTNYLTASQREAVIAHAASATQDGFGVELCPTSNMVLKQDADMGHHQFPLWYRRPSSLSQSLDEHPAAALNGGVGEKTNDGRVKVSINTDDVGLFSTNLTQELLLVAKAFDLSLEDLRQLQLDAAASSFARGASRSRLMRRLSAALPTCARSDGADGAGASRS